MKLVLKPYIMTVNRRRLRMSEILTELNKIRRIKRDIIHFIESHEDYPSSSEMSKQYPYTEDHLRAFYELLIKNKIAYDPVNDHWMVLKKQRFLIKHILKANEEKSQ